MFQDFRQAFRSLRKNPGYSLVALLTLALGIGANTAIFSLVYGVILRPLPYSEGDRLVLLRQDLPLADVENVPFSIKELEDLRTSVDALDLVEHHSMTFTLLSKGEPERVSTGVVSADFFDVLRLPMLHGRNFRPDDEIAGAEAVLILSHPYWRRSFGGDPNVVGKVFEMNNRPHTVIGILPPIPQFPVEHDVYMATSACPFRAQGEAVKETNRSAFRNLTVFGRLAPGVSHETANAALATAASRFAADFPETYLARRGYQLSSRDLGEELSQGARPTLLILLGTTLLVLLIACANVANHTVARQMQRHHEITLRRALGAGRRHLLRLLLAESSLLALAGAALGTLLAYAGLGLLTEFIARFSPRAVDVTLDGWVLLFTLVIGLGTALFSGLAPAFSSPEELAAALHEGAGQTSASGLQRLRGLLIVGQVALAFLLLVGAGLTLRSAYHLQEIDPGFQPESVLAAQIPPNWTTYDTREKMLDLFDRVLERVSAHPGVRSAALAGSVPFGRGAGGGPNQLEIKEHEQQDGDLVPTLDIQIASPNYFNTLEIPLVHGRLFTSGDDAESPSITVISQSLAERYWPGEDPLGDHLRFGSQDPWKRIVGVVGDVRVEGLDRAEADEVYLPPKQIGMATWVLLRTSSEPMKLARSLKEVIWEIDPKQPVASIETLESRHRDATASPRLTALLLGLFAALALLITASGIASVIAFSVVRRTREIGIRLALGASKEGVVWLVLRRSLAQVAAGLALGLVAALSLRHVLDDLLFAVSSDDPATFAAVAIILALTAGLGGLLAARRATSIEPAIALRSD